MKVLTFILLIAMAQYAMPFNLEDPMKSQYSQDKINLPLDITEIEDNFDSLESIPSEELKKIPSAPILVLSPVHEKCEFRVYNYLGQVLNTYSRCIEVSTQETWLMNKLYEVMPHGEKLCQTVKEDEHFKSGNFSIFAMSTGGMMARYLIEYCDFELPIRNLVTLGAPLNGVSALEHLDRKTFFGSILDWTVDRLINYSFMDRVIVAADYWRDPHNLDGYMKHSRFLAEANNEVNFEESRKDSWVHLTKALFIQWSEDDTIIPRESAHWAQYDENFNLVERHDTDLFQKDLIGIKTLEENQQTEYLTWPGEHMTFNFTQINNDVLDTLRM